MTKNQLHKTLLLAAATTFIAGCSFSFNSGAPANGNANAGSPAPGNSKPVASPTPAAAQTAANSPAKADEKPAADAGSTVQVRFPKGETGTEFDETLAPGATKIYVVNVKEGQYLGVQTYSDDDVTFKVRKKGGAELEVPEGDVKWGGEVPESGDYEIVVKGLKKAVKYKIAINAE